MKKSELQDGATAQFVMNTVADTLLNQQREPPPVPHVSLLFSSLFTIDSL